MSKKQHIIDGAIALFNQKGYAAVTLFELAKELNMSRGNLTYHFKDKDILLSTIAQQMWDQIEQERSKTCLLYTSPSPRDRTRSRMPSSA